MKPINIFNVTVLAFAWQNFFLPTPNQIKCLELIVGEMPPNIKMSRKSKNKSKFLRYVATLIFYIHTVQYINFEIWQISVKQHIFCANWKKIIKIIMIIENFKHILFILFPQMEIL